MARRTLEPGVPMHTIQIPVDAMSTERKIAETIRRALPLLPAQARAAVEALLSPTALAIIAVTLAVWAGSHFFGVGEIVDIILLVTGFAILGRSAWDLGKALWDFARLAVNARSEADLDEAAGHFARAVTIGGVDLIMVLLLRRSARGAMVKLKKMKPGMLDTGPPPPAGGRWFYRPRISRVKKLPGDALGDTDAYGNIRITRAAPLDERRMALYHEWLHSVLSPRLVPLRRLRGSIAMSSYKRSALLRYLEEALAEGYAQLQVHGIGHVLKGVTAPIGPPSLGLVSVSQIVAEGRALGTIVVGGHLFYVHMLHEAKPEPMSRRR